uniref:DUF4388 domain-containing protein n=1 Tax=Thermus caliditerrae TaxID=1330700 RepID=A0A7C5RDW2_9DEIN
MIFLRVPLDEFPLAALLASLSRAEKTLALRVEAPFASGELQLFRGNLHHAHLEAPLRAVGLRALDYLLGLRRGEAQALGRPLAKTPTLSHNLILLAEVSRSHALWKRARRLPDDWTLHLQPGRVPVPELAQVRGKTLAEALLAYPALPSRVAAVLSALEGAGAPRFAQKGRFPFLPWPQEAAQGLYPAPSRRRKGGEPWRTPTKPWPG